MADSDWGGDPASAKLTSFLKNRQASTACPSCGTDQWQFVDAAGHTGAVPLVQDDGGWVAPPARVPVYLLICRNCAFVRMHAKADVDQGA